MEFNFEEIIQLGPDKTVYKKIDDKLVHTEKWKDTEILHVSDEALQLISQSAITDVSFLLRTAHLEQVAKILSDPEASDNDQYVAEAMLNNSVIAAEFQLPTCQDTGTAIVLGYKGQNVFTSGHDKQNISKGIFHTYTEKNLRYSQVAPLNFYDEVNTKTNLPAQIDIYATNGGEYKFLFLTKGGGSANKTYLFQETKALLNPESITKFFTEKVKNLGTAACPPYHIAFVIGGTSAEDCLKMVKLASAGYLDSLPNSGTNLGRAFRDREMEDNILKIAQKTGIGAQFGGKYLAHDVRVIRLPRHGASCPVGLGVSCSADRNIKAKITKEGLFIEQLETNPARLLPATLQRKIKSETVEINLNQPIESIVKQLDKYPIKTRLSLTGKIIVARDIAHARIKEDLDQGKPIPQYFKDHIIYYAGPAKTPTGMASGSFGPTTANRMDPYIPIFQKMGASLVTLAKGNRSSIVRQSCQENGGFYLGSIGGPAALLAKENIKKVETVAYPELGMEAIWAIEVENFPAFIIIDNKGNDFFSMI